MRPTDMHDATPAFDAYLERIRGGDRFKDLPEKDHDYLLDAVQGHNGNILIAWHIFKSGYQAALREDHKARQALQAIADAEPATVHGAYDTEDACDRCMELIAMAQEGLEGEEVEA